MNILVEKNLMVPMSDGTQLATDVYRGVDGAPAPTLVLRMPYNKEGFATPEIFAFVQAGYRVRFEPITVAQQPLDVAFARGDFKVDFDRHGAAYFQLGQQRGDRRAGGKFTLLAVAYDLHELFLHLLGTSVRCNQL